MWGKSEGDLTGPRSPPKACCDRVHNLTWVLPAKTDVMRPEMWVSSSQGSRLSEESETHNLFPMKLEG